LTSAALARCDWLDHGFGTRDSQLDQGAMASLTQIHSARVLRVDGIGLAGEADALITNATGVPLSIRTADCFPILLADPEPRAVAAVHAGWRGTADEIISRALDMMRSEFGTSPQQIIAAIGPGIGPCCYQIGEEVARRFGLTAAGYVDLAAINREQLIRAGVPASQIDTLRHCTRCESELFHSYRRDGDRAGRMISYVVKH
jgi:purine-nucleoside/S-methyl-5'-thioadenosine phosphorylase / adenosine deaminase